MTPSAAMSPPGQRARARLAAARARAAGGLPLAQRGLLGGLPAVWQVVDAGDRVLLAVQGDYQLHRVDRRELPVGGLTPTQTRALLGVLAATFTGAVHPWPGRPATVGAVLEVLGGVGLDPLRAAQLRGALKRLHTYRLAVVGPGDLPEPVGVADATPVTVGPAVAAWSGPWVAELMTLVAAVAARHPWALSTAGRRA